MSSRYVAILLLASLSFALGASDVLVKPTKQDPAQPTACLVVLQGAQVPAAEYLDLAREIQKASGLNLWVGLPSFLLDTPEPLVVKKGVQRVVKALKGLGMPDEAHLLIGGHSLGGIMAQDAVAGDETRLGASALVLFGSYVQRKYRDDLFPVPVLTVGAELDGLSRITRLAEAFYHTITKPVFGERPEDFPVTVVEGMTHAQFFTGPPPTLVKQRDLKPEIDDASARANVGAIVAAFLDVQLSTGEHGVPVLRREVARTGDLVEPILKSFSLEGFRGYSPPCNAEGPKPNCTVGSPWTSEFAMSIMAGLDDKGVKLNVSDEFHPVWQVNPVHLPHVHNQCDAPDSSCTLNINTVSENVYEKLDDLDTAFASVSASEIRVKLVARQAAWIGAGIKDANFTQLDEVPTCQVINQAAIDWALSNAGAKAKSRYERSGEKMVAGDDMGPYSGGPTWIWNSLKYNKEKDGQGNQFVEIRSPMIRTPVDFWLKVSAGFHYCKMLSPARVMEWIYVDSLRLNNSIQTSSDSAELMGQPIVIQ